MKKKSIRDVDLSGKLVFIRADFNVPIKNGVITDDTRIRAAIPTVNYALSRGGRVVLASHLGRPIKDKKKAEEKGMEYDPTKYSLKPVFEYLLSSPELQIADVYSSGGSAADSNSAVQTRGRAVFFAEDCIGDAAREKMAGLAAGQLLLLENLRLHAGEEKNDPLFAEQLADGFDVFVNDAFGTAHRAHASTEGITHFIGTCVAGFLMENELDFLGKALDNPERPFVAILGGAKVSDKIPVIESLIKRRVDKLLIGGAMAYTFLKARGQNVGKSLVENEMIPKAREIEEMAADMGTDVLLPTDHQVVDSYEPLNSRKSIPIEFTNVGNVGLDIGPETAARFSDALVGAKTILWNGPMGMFEEKPYDEGTAAIARAVAKSTESGATSIVGGGDSVSAVKQAGLADKISHISTGGGATLEFLAGDLLPGVEALDDN